jgi:hypothetical protein
MRRTKKHKGYPFASEAEAKVTDSSTKIDVLGVRMCWEQRLYYLEQYTSGEPRNLVRSFHLPPTHAYQEATKQLQWHFGNKIRITSAFMDRALGWPAIKAEVAPGLRSYAIFLKSCRNTMQEVDVTNGEPLSAVFMTITRKETLLMICST